MTEDKDALSKKLPNWLRHWPGVDPEVPAAQASRGSFSSHKPTSRERMFDLINETFYGGEGVGSEGNKYAHRLANLLDFTPVGTLNQAYDTGRAIGEGRFKDAAISSGLAFLPALRKAPAGLFNPIPKPPRNVLDDFPSGAKLDDEGYVAHDMEGRPFDALYRVGRTRLDAPDHALTPIDIQRVGEYAIEGPINKNSRKYFDSGTLGETWQFGGKPGYVHILDSLPQADADIVTAHEVGHVIDQLAGEIPTKGLEEELNSVYNALKTGKERKYLQSLPEDSGYSGTDVPREKMAEAIRAYMVDPNHLKTVASKTASRIRQWVNSHPELSKIIQFNTIAAGGGLGLGTIGGSEDSEAREMRQGKEPQSGIFKGADSGFAPATKAASNFAQIAQTLLRQGLASQMPARGRYGPIVRALMNLQTGKPGGPSLPRP